MGNTTCTGGYCVYYGLYLVSRLPGQERLQPMDAGADEENYAHPVAVINDSDKRQLTFFVSYVSCDE